MIDDTGTKVVPIPGGEKLLSNIESSGRLLIRDYEIAREYAHKDDALLAILEGHSRIGQAMIDAVGRTRVRMDS